MRPFERNQVEEQQKLGILSALDEAMEGKRNKGEQGNKAVLWPQQQPEKMRLTPRNQKQQTKIHHHV